MVHKKKESDAALLTRVTRELAKPRIVKSVRERKEARPSEDSRAIPVLPA
jgi:hypothetical protein